MDCFLKEEKESDERVLVDVTIKDTGIGMSEDFLKNIFQPFVQADQAPDHTIKVPDLAWRL